MTPVAPTTDWLGQDRRHLYLHKPAGLPVLPPHQDPEGDCLYRRLLLLDPARSAGWPEAFPGGIAHRIDTGTSGLVIVARTPRDLDRLRQEFSSRSLRKFYQLLSRSDGGLAVGATTVVTQALAHHARRPDRMVAQRPSGHPGRHRGRWYEAWSSFRRLPDDRQSRFEVEIRTGVMHQIRVHAAYLGAPVWGDPIYEPDGDPPENHGRMWLHHLRVEGPDWESPAAPAWGPTG